MPLWVIGSTATWELPLPACAPQPVNPTFPNSVAWALRDLKRMAADPRPLKRPLVVISGFLDPGLAAPSMHSQFSKVTWVIRGSRRFRFLSAEFRAMPPEIVAGWWIWRFLPTIRCKR